MKELIGKIVTKIQVSEGQHALAFTLGTGELIIYEAWGGSCSETWFADIIGVDSLLNSTVLNVEEISMEWYNVDDGRTRQNIDEAYGYKLYTDKGTTDIIFRNSSNGYYGGNINLYEETVLPSLDTFETISSDWQA